MDEIVELLRSWAPANSGGRGNWNLTHTSIIVRVEVTADEGFDSPLEAFERARAMVDQLVSLGWTPVNHAEIGVVSSPVDAADTSWRPDLRVALHRGPADPDLHEPVGALR